MRAWIFTVLMLTAPLVSAQTGVKAPGRKIEKVVLVVLAKDSAIAAEVESSLRDGLMEKGVVGYSIRTLLSGKSPSGVSELSKLFLDQGYDSVMCMGPRRTMMLTPKDKASDFPTMESCLSSFLTGKYPSGESLQSSPFTAEAQPTAEATNDYATPRTPIASNSGAAPVTYYKRKMRVFDVSTKNLLWEGQYNVKIANDMRTSFQAKKLAQEAVKTLKKSGLLP